MRRSFTQALGAHSSLSVIATRLRDVEAIGKEVNNKITALEALATDELKLTNKERTSLNAAISAIKTELHKINVALLADTYDSPLNQ